MPTTATRQRPDSTRGIVLSSARQSAADVRSKRELLTGITIASAYMTTRARSRPVRPPGVSITTWSMPTGVRTNVFASTFQPTMRVRSPLALRCRSQARVDCWRSISPSATAAPTFANTAAKCVASVLLPLPPFRLTTAMTDMSAALVWCSGGAWVSKRRWTRYYSVTRPDDKALRQRRKRKPRDTPAVFWWPATCGIRRPSSRPSFRRTAHPRSNPSGPRSRLPARSSS